MLVYIHLIKNFGDLAILVDQECLSSDAHVLLPVHRLLAPNAVRFNDAMIGVCDQVHRQIVFRSELLVRLFVIGRDAKQLDVLFFEVVVRITERACFLGSARGVVFRIKEQDHALTFEVR